MAGPRKTGASLTFLASCAQPQAPRRVLPRSASCRATWSARPSVVLLALLPSHCTAKNASSDDRAEVRSRSWRRLCGPRRAEENGGFVEPPAGGPERCLARSSGWAIKSPCYRRRSWRKDGRTPGATQENGFGLHRLTRGSTTRRLPGMRSRTSKTSMVPRPVFSPPRRGAAPHNGAPIFIRGTNPSPEKPDSQRG